jgi:tetratricopeptide (TPR) repeat protein
MLSLALAFGIFFTLSCSTIQNTETTSSTGDDAATLQEKINEVNQEISANPNNAQLQVKKANLLFQRSQNVSQVENRNPIYQNIRDIADGYSSNLNISNQLDDVLSKAWHLEKQTGMSLLQKNEAVQSEIFSKIESHFQNAITLIPDSLQTYSLLATSYYQNGNLNQAIATLVQAEDQHDSYEPAISEKLAYLYLESGDLSEAERRYIDLVDYDPDKLIYQHGLINVIILSDKHEQAVEMLEQLSGEYPTRYAYQEALATELYYLFRTKTESIASLPTNGEMSEEEQEELTSLLRSVHTIFESIEDSFPTTEENLHRMASFYKNASSRLSQLPETNPELEEMEQSFMEYALPFWERLAEINSDNLGYINNLYQVYLELDMQEEAESIERSYNF